MTAIMASDRNRREGETDKGHETLSMPARYTDQPHARPAAPTPPLISTAALRGPLESRGPSQAQYTMSNAYRRA